MPTYEYECGGCGHQFERVQRISEDSSAECPKCGAVAERLISGGAGLLFKGPGFYITDYRSESYKQAEQKEKKEKKEKKSSDSSGVTGGAKAGSSPTARKRESKKDSK